MKRNGAVGAGLVLILSAWGCDTLLGLPEDPHTQCITTDKRCNVFAKQVCVNGIWETVEDCPDGCANGECWACLPGAKICVGNEPQECNANGEWQKGEMCADGTCLHGECAGACVPGSKRCNLNYPQVCDATETWQDAIPCTIWAPSCDDGECKVPRSCVGLPENCGPLENESCCTVTELPGGTYNRSNDPMFPATVSAFQLDRFEITVGRFRKFVEAYSRDIVQEGQGAHPHIEGSGWKAEFQQALPMGAKSKDDREALEMALICHPVFSTWTITSGTNDNLPMNCISWYEAFAFCIWDGGRLPTEAEWQFAMRGGNEQRYHPWSLPPTSMNLDATCAVYDCNGDGDSSMCKIGDIVGVGSRSPKGDGKWHQADLAGSVWEWMYDLREGDTNRQARGGYWGNSAPNLALQYGEGSGEPDKRYEYLGARCARDLRR